MNIAILNSKDRGGGAAEIARQIAHGYRAAGHSVHWIVGTKVDATDDTVTEIPVRGGGGRLAKLGARVLQLSESVATRGRGRLRWRRAMQMAHARSMWAQWRGHEDFELPGARRILDALPWRPDVVHAHNLHSFNHHTHFDLRLLPEMSRQIATIVTLHDAWLLTGHCAQFVACERWRSGCGACPNLGIFPPIRRDATHRNWRIKAALYARSRIHVVGVNEWIANAAADSILAQGLASLRVIRNGIDTREFTPTVHRDGVRARLGIPPEAKVILFASELGLRNPFRDFATMQAIGVELAVRLAPGPVVVVELGAERAGSRRQGNLHVLSPGFIPRTEVVRWLQASDVVLHAAIADTSPTIIYEAMACGIPVVATHVAGIPEQIVDGQTGLLVPAGARVELSAAVHGLLVDEARCAALGAAARRKVESEFTVERMAAGYLKMLEEFAPSA